MTSWRTLQYRLRDGERHILRPSSPPQWRNLLQTKFSPATPHAASGWRIYCGVEVTELSTNKQLSLSLLFSLSLSVSQGSLPRLYVALSYMGRHIWGVSVWGVSFLSLARSNARSRSLFLSFFLFCKTPNSEKNITNK